MGFRGMGSILMGFVLWILADVRVIAHGTWDGHYIISFCGTICFICGVWELWADRRQS